MITITRFVNIHTRFIFCYLLRVVVASLLNGLFSLARLLLRLFKLQRREIIWDTFFFLSSSSSQGKSTLQRLTCIQPEPFRAPAEFQVCNPGLCHLKSLIHK